jgi:hypothetical protein
MRFFQLITEIPKCMIEASTADAIQDASVVRYHVD